MGSVGCRLDLVYCTVVYSSTTLWPQLYHTEKVPSSQKTKNIYRKKATVPCSHKEGTVPFSQKKGTVRVQYLLRTKRNSVQKTLPPHKTQHAAATQTAKFTPTKNITSHHITSPPAAPPEAAASSSNGSSSSTCPDRTQESASRNDSGAGEGRGGGGGESATSLRHMGTVPSTLIAVSLVLHIPDDIGRGGTGFSNYHIINK